MRRAPAPVHDMAIVYSIVLAPWKECVRSSQLLMRFLLVVFCFDAAECARASVREHLWPDASARSQSTLDAPILDIPARRPQGSFWSRRRAPHADGRRAAVLLRLQGGSSAAAPLDARLWALVQAIVSSERLESLHQLTVAVRTRAEAAIQVYAEKAVPYVLALRDGVGPSVAAFRASFAAQVAWLRASGIPLPNQAFFSAMFARAHEACVQAGISTATVEALTVTMQSAPINGLPLTATAAADILVSAPLAQMVPVLGVFPLVDACLGWLLWRRTLRPVDVRRSPAPPPTCRALCVGARVMIKGLGNAAQYNRMQGVVRGKEGKRWAVAVQGLGEELVLKGKNLQVLGCTPRRSGVQAGAATAPAALVAEASGGIEELDSAQSGNRSVVTCTAEDDVEAPPPPPVSTPAIKSSPAPAPTFDWRGPIAAEEERLRREAEAMRRGDDAGATGGLGGFKGKLSSLFGSATSEVCPLSRARAHGVSYVRLCAWPLVLTRRTPLFVPMCNT